MTEVQYFTRLSGEALAQCYRGAAGFEAILRPTEALVLSGQPHADFNYALLDESVHAAAALREFVGIAGTRGVPLIAMATPAAAATLEPVAAELGLQAAGSFPLMTRDGAMPERSETDYACRAATGEEDLLEANRILSLASGIPVEAVNAAYGPAVLGGAGFELFLASRKGEPICAVQTTRAGGGDVGIWAMVTPPAFQRQGAGRALLGHVLAHHVERGAKRFYLGSTAAGRKLYESFGFGAIGEWTVWLSGESSQAHG
jgi:GNAT superfamily N-acetyltransferase